MAKSKNTQKVSEAVLVGAGIAAVAAATYFLTGKKGEKNRKHLKGWAVKMKGEVLEKLEDAKEVTEPIYNNIVDTVAKASMAASSVSRKEVVELADQLKKDWKAITRAAKGPSKGKKKTKVTAKKTTTKTSKKTTKSKSK